MVVWGGALRRAQDAAPVGAMRLAADQTLQGRLGFTRACQQVGQALLYGQALYALYELVVHVACAVLHVTSSPVQAPIERARVKHGRGVCVRRGLLVSSPFRLKISR